MSKDTHKFQCTEKCARAYQEFRQQVIVTPILAMPVRSKDYTIWANASKDRLGCVLL